MRMGVYQVSLTASRPGFWGSLSLVRRMFDVVAADRTEAESLAIARAKAEGDLERITVDRVAEF